MNKLIFCSSIFGAYTYISLLCLLKSERYIISLMAFLATLENPNLSNVKTYSLYNKRDKRPVSIR